MEVTVDSIVEAKRLAQKLRIKGPYYVMNLGNGGIQKVVERPFKKPHRAKRKSVGRPVTKLVWVPRWL